MTPQPQQQEYIITEDTIEEVKCLSESAYDRTDQIIGLLRSHPTASTLEHNGCLTREGNARAKHDAAISRAAADAARSELLDEIVEWIRKTPLNLAPKFKSEFYDFVQSLRQPKERERK